MSITKAKFVSEDFARKWHTLGCQYRNDDIKTAAIKAGLDFIHECQRWDAQAAFEAGKNNLPFEIKQWKRYGEIPIDLNGYAGRCLNYITGQLDMGVYAATEEWEKGGGPYLKVSGPIKDLIRSVREVIFMEREPVYFMGILVGYGPFEGEPLVLPITIDDPAVELSTFLNVLVPELFYNPYGIHGLGHTKRVLTLCNKLAELNELNPDERKILHVSALWHDIGRTNDFFDYHHGISSFAKAIKMRLYPYDDLTESELEIVRYIVENHPIDDTDGIRNVANYSIDRDIAIKLYSIFKDADGLDRLRIGDLNPKYLRNQYSHGLIGYASELLHA